MAHELVDYRVLVDWQNSGGLSLFDFEQDSQGWEPGGDLPPIIGATHNWSSRPEAFHRFKDPFTSAPSSHLWPVQEGNVSASAGTLSLQATSSYSTVQSNEIYDLAGSGVSAQISIPSFTSGGREFFFELTDGPETVAGFRWSTTSETMIMFARKILSLNYFRFNDSGAGFNLGAFAPAGGGGNGTIEEDTAPIGYSPTNMSYLRIRRTDEMIRWEASRNGYEWNTLWSNHAFGARLRGLAVRFSAGFFTGSPPVSFMQVSNLNEPEQKVRSGRRSLQIAWRSASSGTFPRAFTFVDKLIVGRQYTLQADVWVSNASPHVRLGVIGLGTGSFSSVKEQWQRITHTFTATSQTAEVYLQPSGNVSSGAVFVDSVRMLAPYDDVSLRARATGLRAQRGRAGSRSTDDSAPSEGDVELDNRDRIFSPENQSSPLIEDLEPGREMLVQAEFQDREYTLLRGHVDDYEVHSDQDRDERVTFSSLDPLAKLRDSAKLSTELYRGVRTGEAIGIVLDSIDWPKSKRDLDLGASVLPWWYVDDEDAYEAMLKVVASEGPPATIYLSPNGTVVFRDRHHRGIRAESLQGQATWRGGGGEPHFSEIGYSAGWKDIANKVEFSVPVRLAGPMRVDGFLEAERPGDILWEQKGVISVATGQTRVIEARAATPFYGALVPELGRDYELDAGSVNISLTRTSGISTEIRIHSPGTMSIIRDLKIRAIPVETRWTFKISAKDSVSIEKHGVRDYSGQAPEFVNVHDALAIAELLVAKRAHRRVALEVTMKSGQAEQTIERTWEQLEREISDCIHIQSDRLGIFGDRYHIERIEHDIRDVGHEFTTTFHIERVLEHSPDAFTLDESLLNTGRLGRHGVSDPSKLFIIGQSMLDNDLLGR